ncbi:hypothetical protein [Priestia megaterium]|uniref:hypothetical protein n=1 Tax=Priestia megaterium TaxID=1404 RepID=UPI00272FCE5C|nr:hypothetical protein [Priestia megaterium]MDP1442129.1 hypothetical protein [Priestia megaterium]MDP1471094.1 hypothetical protein [Priestia megaterium]
MEKWEGKIKGYNQLGDYVGTYQATIEKQDNLLYKMTLSFDDCYTYRKRESKYWFKQNILYSSSVQVLKRKFRDAIILKVKSKVLWKRKILLVK